MITHPRTYYLIYVSSATRLMDQSELRKILEQAREKNKRLNITGLLLYQAGNFMQMLEGEKQPVLDLYQAIQRDPRHKDVITVRSFDIAERNFPDWSMGFFDMDRSGDLPAYRDYIADNITLRSFREDSEAARDFMLLFHRINR